MRKHVAAVVVVVALVGTPLAANVAQAPSQPSSAPGTAASAPLRLQIVISRYQGEKRVSSMPYELSLRSGPPQNPGTASLRLGARIPVPNAVFPTAGDPGAPAPGPVTSFNYEPVGINIDCAAAALENGRFGLEIEVNESSAVTDVQDLRNITGGNRPVFRSYQSNNNLVLGDGETSRFTAATDRVTGEVVRVEVTLTVLK